MTDNLKFNRVKYSIKENHILKYQYESNSFKKNFLNLIFFKNKLIKYEQII